MKTEKVCSALNKCGTEKGMTASELATMLGLSRSNVSSKLNELVKQGKAVKRKGKPVYFSSTHGSAEQSGYHSLESFQQQNPSLYSAIAQSRSAVLYPPRGMNILLTGETGVGKSMFAEMLHDYAIESGQLRSDAPFITFNCADYASNPQLLLAWLFGVHKGAYTGATEHRAGLLEQADGGTLFLDEVHRLPPEGQEMFFTFIDKGIWRRFGDATTERTAQVRILAATTESPDSALLNTFTRRFPVVIALPALRERTPEERFNLIKRFFNHESSHLGKNITVSANTLRALLSYPCANNIGQLQADIRFICATAWADFCAGIKSAIYVKSYMLPEQARQALFSGTEHREASRIIGINSKEMVFSDSQAQKITEDGPNRSVFDLIQIRMAELKSQNVAASLAEKIIKNYIADFFRRAMHHFSDGYDKTTAKHTVFEKTLPLTSELIGYAELQLQKKFPQRLYHGLASHIRQAVERARNNKAILCPGLNTIRTSHREIFAVALDCLQMTEQVMAVTLPVDEAGFLSLLFLSALEEEPERQYVRVFVVAHGNNMATELVNTASELLGVDYALAFNAPLNSPVREVLERIIARIQAFSEPADIMLLVDMGSLTAFAPAIEARCGVKVSTLPLASTLHVIEAVQSAMQGNALPVVCRDVQEVSPLLGTVYSDGELIQPPVRYSMVRRRLAVVTLCTTGEGTARLIREALSSSLSWRKNLTEIIPLDIPQQADITDCLQKLSIRYKVIAVISPFPVESDIPWFTLADIIQGEGVSTLCELIATESIWAVVGSTLEHSITNLPAEALLNEIRQFYQRISAAFTVSLSVNMLTGLIMHLACLFDRKTGQASEAAFHDKSGWRVKHAAEIDQLRLAIRPAEQRFAVTLSDEELCCIYRFWQEQDVKSRSSGPAPDR